MVREGLEGNYPQLQNLIKRDPGSYEEEFRQQYEHFQSAWSLLLMGQSPGPHLEAMLMFVAHCAPQYKKLTADFGSKMIVEALENVDRLSNMEPSLRRSIVQAALLLQRDKMILPTQLIPILFNLLRVRDKGLRELVSTSITQNLKKATPQLSKHVLNFLEQTLLAVDGLEDAASGSAAIQSLSILIAVYAKGNANDPRPINIIANAGLNEKNVKLSLLSLNFLIGSDEQVDEADDSDSDDSNQADSSTVRQAYSKMRISGKTKSRQAKIERLVKKTKHEGRKKKSKTRNTMFPAIQQLYDPQKYSDKLLSILKRSTAPFESKLVMMNALSLIIGNHQLVLPDFYPILLRYLQPHQRNVTKVLCYAAQSAHSALPGDILAVTVRAIANNFVAEHCAAPVIAAGLNAIRECCVRCPAAMDDTLLGDLALYKGFKDKSVMMAARSLIGLFREVSPELLHKKDRGRPEKKPKLDNPNISDGDDNDDDESDASDASETIEEVDIMSKSQYELLSPDDLQKMQQETATTAASSTTISPYSLLSASKKKLSKAERLEQLRSGKQPDRKFGAAGKTAEHRASGKSQSNKVQRRSKLLNMLKRSKAGLYGGKKPRGVKKRRHA